MADVDLSDFYKLSRPKRPPCQIALILKGDLGPALGRTSLAQLKAALATDKGVITAAAIQEWLAGKGHEITVNKISNHRRGVCTCG